MKLKIAMLLLASMLSAYNSNKAVLTTVKDVDLNGVRIVLIDQHFCGFYNDSVDIGDSVIVFVNDCGTEDKTDDRIEYSIKVCK